MDSRQELLDEFRAKLKLERWIISESVKAPFAESLREYCRKNEFEFHVEVEYEKCVATLYMTFDTHTVTVSGKVEHQSIKYPDELDNLEDLAAKHLVSSKI